MTYSLNMYVHSLFILTPVPIVYPYLYPLITRTHALSKASGYMTGILKWSDAVQAVSASHVEWV